MKKNIILSLLLLAFVVPSYAQEWNSSSNPPFGWAWLKTYNIKFSHRGKTPLTGFDMIYTTSKTDSRYKDPKDVKYVYIILDNEYRAPNNIGAMPPKVMELIYHKLDDGTKFCGLIIHGDYVKKDGEIVGRCRQEIRIDNDTANLLVDLLYGDSEWKDMTGIKFSVSQSPRLTTPEFY